MDSFGEWLLLELEQRNMSQGELARLSGLSRGTISNIISGARGRGPDSLRAISRALKLSPETVFRHAGLLPPGPKKSELIERILHEMEDLPPEDKEDVMDFIEFKARQLDKKRKSHKK